MISRIEKTATRVQVYAMENVRRLRCRYVDDYRYYTAVTDTRPCGRWPRPFAAVELIELVCTSNIECITIVLHNGFDISFIQ